MNLFGISSGLSSQALATSLKASVILCGCILSQACSVTQERFVFDPAEVPSLKYDNEIYSPEEVLANTPDIDILAINDEMREFVRIHTRESSNSKTRLMSLHWAIKSPGNLGMQYDPFADGDAVSTFRRGTANCLSYAHMFVSLAREAGLNAQYQWMEVRPEWHRIGERVAVRLHVNVQVKMRDGSEFMVDIDPLNRSQIAGSKLISDEEALGLYYNNLAMLALTEERPVYAWKQLIRGLKAAPTMSHLWVNMGAIFRLTGQYREAEQAYFQALNFDAGDRSAMNNLVVLYELEGRQQEQEYWLDRLRRYRDLNPYYHANLGELALNQEDWTSAAKHFARAHRLHPADSQIIYNRGLVEHHRGNDERALELITEAIKSAALTVEKERYRIQLQAIEQSIEAAAL
ncbi:MAG: tetratricopeptide repeat protein [Pseudomonadota bacterium]